MFVKRIFQPFDTLRGVSYVAVQRMYLHLQFVYCVLYCLVYVYLLLFVSSVLVQGLLPQGENSIAVSNNNNNVRDRLVHLRTFTSKM